MRLLTRFAIAALVAFFVSALIATASYSLGLWLGRNSYNLRLIIYSSIPLSLLLGFTAAIQSWRKAGEKSNPMVPVLAGAVVAVLYTFFVVRIAPTPAFVVLMLSCWVPSGISAMLAAAAGKRLFTVGGITILCLCAIFLTEPLFNVFAHNQELTVAIVTPAEASTDHLRAQPETLGFQRPDEILTAKYEVSQQLRAFGYGENFRVLSVTRRGKGKKSLAIIVVRAPITSDAVLPEPFGSTVVYMQRAESWDRKPVDAPVLHRGIEMRPPSLNDGNLGFFAIPDASGIELVGRVAAKSLPQGS
jgi:hypothetical protein